MMINHIAFVMDGNRRWARKNGFAVKFGHSSGVDSVKKVIEFCLKKEIKYLSLYTFSIENFKRSELEKRFIFSLLSTEIVKSLSDLKKQGVKIRFVGDRSLFPDSVKKNCDMVEEQTKSCEKLNLNLLFCYGGRQEIVDSVKIIVKKVKDGILSEDSICEKTIENNMWSGNVPDPDIIVRTGGAYRLSNFLLYQAAYSELLFIDKFWPDMTMSDFDKVYEEFKYRKRRFGK